MRRMKRERMVPNIDVHGVAYPKTAMVIVCVKVTPNFTSFISRFTATQNICSLSVKCN